MRSRVGSSAGTPQGAFGVVDVRDVATAHIRGMLVEEAAGKRFLLTSDRSQTKLEMMNLLRLDHKAEVQSMPPTMEDAAPGSPKFNTNLAKNVLKVKFRPSAESVLDMARAFVRDGLYDTAVAKAVLDGSKPCHGYAPQAVAQKKVRHLRGKQQALLHRLR